MIAYIKMFFDIIIPRFLTEDVVVVDVGDHYELAFPLRFVTEGEMFDGIVTLQTFNFFGVGCFSKQLGELRKFTGYEWKDFK